MELDKLRQKINGVDDKIATLYLERMELCKEVGAYKQKNNIALENSQREKEILNRVTEFMPTDLKLFGKQVFSTMFDTSKAYQSRLQNAHAAVKDDIVCAIGKGILLFPISASVACQGVEGAFSSLAVEKMFELSSISYFKDWNSVFTAVEKGFSEYGVLPIENSSVGSVNGVYDLMRKHKFYIVKSIKLRVQHFLLAKSGTKIEDIKEIVSHEQAILQCSKLANEFANAKITMCDNTAQAAKIVAESGSLDIACIASRECASIYGLKILRPSVADNDNNYTRFIAISKSLQIFENASKISIMVNLPHEAGSLNKILNRFSTLGLNLTKLESRPIPNSMFEFAFYFDFDANVAKIEVQNLLAELESSCEKLEFLGSYEEV